MTSGASLRAIDAHSPEAWLPTAKGSRRHGCNTLGTELIYRRDAEMEDFRQSGVRHRA